MSVTRRVLFYALVTVLTVGVAANAEAQHRHGPGRSAVVVGGGYYYNPFWFGYGYGFGYGYPWYGFGYGYPWYPYQYGPYPYYYVDRGSAVRLEVSPKEAEVYVDGYYAGIVDDYDGTFQRLHLPPGEHEIELYREGYRTVHQNVYLTPESTFKVRYMMERLAAGDAAEPRPTPSTPPPSTQTQTQIQTEPGQGPPPSTRHAPDGRRLPPPNQRGPRTGDASSSGALSIRVQPDNATVLIDGERWEGPHGQERLIVQVSDGPHQIQIQREGYESFTANVTVRQGETVPLNVSLRTR